MIRDLLHQVEGIFIKIFYKELLSIWLYKTAWSITRSLKFTCREFLDELQFPVLREVLDRRAEVGQYCGRKTSLS